MEIGSMGTMADLMGVQGTRGGASPLKPDTGKMSSRFMDAMGSDGDDALAGSELTASGGARGTGASEAFDALDTNKDGIVSQEEIQADMESRMGTMPGGNSSGPFSGIRQDGDSRAFQSLMNMIGGSSGADQARMAQSYGSMQAPSFDGQGLSAGLNLRA